MKINDHIVRKCIQKAGISFKMEGGGGGGFILVHADKIKINKKKLKTNVVTEVNILPSLEKLM